MKKVWDWGSKKIIFSLFFLFLGVSFADDLVSVVTNAQVYANVGVVADYYDYNGDGVSNLGAMWGFGEFGFVSGQWYGLQAGLDAMIPIELWEDHSGDYSTIFEEDYVIRSLYLGYTLLDTKSSIILGRNCFNKSPVMDGDSHQGIQVQVKDFDFVEFSASAIYRWINDADVYSVSGRGISGWDSVDAIGDYAGDVFYSAYINIKAVPEYITVNPFFSWQDDVMGAVGASWDCSYSLSKDWSLGFDGVYSRFINQYPESVEPDYEDINVMLFHGAIKHASGSYFGVGWYDLGSGSLNASAGMFNLFDPMDRDDFIGYDDKNDTSMYYLDYKFKTDDFDIYGLMSSGRNRPNDTDFVEFDLWAYYNVCSNTKVGLYYVYTDYSTNVLADYSRFGLSFTFSFL